MAYIVAFLSAGLGVLWFITGSDKSSDAQILWYIGGIIWFIAAGIWFSVGDKIK